MHSIPAFRQCATFVLVSLCLFVLPVLGQSGISDEIAGIRLESLRETGFRVDWINQSNGNDLRMPTISGDSLYILDAEDYLTRYDLHSGKWRWSSPVGNKVYQLRGITEFAKSDRVYVMSDGAVYVLERATGNYPTSRSENGSSYSGQKQMIPLKWVANTPSITTDQRFLIYGSNTGEAVWFNPSIGFDIHRYRIGSSINTPIVFAYGIRNKNGLTRDLIIGSSTDGLVTAVDVHQLNKVWDVQYTKPVETAVAFGTNSSIINDETYPRTTVFIAGADQYIHAVDLLKGKQRWNYLTTSNLTDSPVFHNDVVYQRIPNVGLAAFSAFPQSLSGNQLWVADNVKGNVITTTRNGQLVCWDIENMLLQVVDPRKGGVVSSMKIPAAKSLITDSTSEGSLYVLTTNNTMLRLIPRK
jgi:hypothetical protein